MRIATWNIYWLGDRSGSKIIRSEADEDCIAHVISTLTPDVLALQEIVDPAALARILAAAGGNQRNYSIQLESGQWLTSDSKPTDPTNNFQKVFLAINTAAVRLIRGAAVRGGPGGRRPFAAELEHLASGRIFTVVAVHLRSGFPVFLDPDDAAKRREEATGLARWLRGEAEAQNESFPRPESDSVAVLGDFNAELDDPNHSLDPLRGGELADWIWEEPIADSDQSATAIDDGYTIDFISLSPAMAADLAARPRVYAFDHDAALGGPEVFHSGPQGSGPLKSLGVSDHRPVLADLAY